MSSRLVPGLRVHHATKRYPKAVFVDLVEGSAIAEYLTTLTFRADGCIEHDGTQETRVIETRP